MLQELIISGIWDSFQDTILISSAKHLLKRGSKISRTVSLIYKATVTIILLFILHLPENLKHAQNDSWTIQSDRIFGRTFIRTPDVLCNANEIYLFFSFQSF